VESHELYAQHIDIIHDGLQVNGPHTQHIHDFIDDHQQSLEDINKRMHSYDELPSESNLESDWEMKMGEF
jgi:hypothetical protein